MRVKREIDCLSCSMAVQCIDSLLDYVDVWGFEYVILVRKRVGRVRMKQKETVIVLVIA